jgi:hypothetical protein
MEIIKSNAKQSEQLKEFEEAKKKMDEFKDNIDKIIEKKTKNSFIDRMQLNN